LAKNNIYAKAIKSPTVKVGSERIRICIHSFNTPSEIDLLIKTISEFK
jgi:8-amino-7-oxononanoate synthase